jgi:hypothetical protein
VSMDAPFHGGSNDTIGGLIILRRPEISPLWFELVCAVQGPLIRVCPPCVRFLGMFLFMVAYMTSSAATSDTSGQRYCCLLMGAYLFLPCGSRFCRKNKSLLSHKFSLMSYIPVRNNQKPSKLYTNVNYTTDKIFHRCQLHR